MSFMASPRKIPKQSRFFFFCFSLSLFCSPSHSCCHSFSRHHPSLFTHFCCFQYTRRTTTENFLLCFYFLSRLLVLEAMLTILSDFPFFGCTCEEEDAWELWHTNLWVQTHTHATYYTIPLLLPPTLVAFLFTLHFFLFSSHLFPLSDDVFSCLLTLCINLSPMRVDLHSTWVSRSQFWCSCGGMRATIYFAFGGCLLWCQFPFSSFTLMIVLCVWKASSHLTEAFNYSL
jgi:hypothetical protein